jgi:hypothetical protein
VESQIEPAHALVFPYLWIRGRMTVGPYEIISRGAFTDDDFTSPQMKSELEGLLKMYEARGSMADRFGSVVRRRDGKVGDRFERDEMRPLRRAMVAALLDGNPLEIGKKEDTQGWHVATSDNALLYLHQLDGSGYVAVQYGRMVELTVAGLKIGMVPPGDARHPEGAPPTPLNRGTPVARFHGAPNSGGRGRKAPRSLCS